MSFAGERRSDRTSTMRIVFYLFGPIAGFRPSLRWLRLSGRRPSFAGTVLGFGRIGAGDPATVLADRRSRPSCARRDEPCERTLGRAANQCWGFIDLGLVQKTSRHWLTLNLGWPPRNIS